ncbi:efflux transporter outer membrane subunit [Sphingomonas bacterium]|uniref:efflux transporter outer membrane subunit n=1 Tax=Sphingomonas bacterium TaxID=1895847 RepID=UPI00261016AE|nr:efflux transporter outer membrane subunit [Sphingomonas bacterium]MDB5679340.1 efflux transporter, outer rane factor lipoprotein NodT family [Sphingomonas bacterium]
MTVNRRYLAPLLASLMTTSCVVGPNFKQPAAPPVSGYTATPPDKTVATPDVPGGEAQRFVSGGDIPADWWTLFHSKPLNALIEQALANNADLKTAQAALLAAQENTRAQRGSYAPKVSAGVGITRERDPSGALAPVPSNNAFLYTLVTPQLSVSYVPDVFGLNKRTVEAATAQAQASRYQMVAVYVTISTNVAAAAIQEAALEDQIDATNELIGIDREMLGVLSYQKSKGYVSGADVVAQQTQLAQLEASLPPLIKQRDQQNNLIAVLTGQFPGQAPPPKFSLASFTLPSDLPLSLPSVLVERRPDILQAQANLHAASAQVGIATANRLPNITLSANAGSTALAIGQVFGPGTGFWNLGAALLAPIFDGGTLLHQQRAARAAYRQSAEQYRGTVLTAFQNVADTLTALDQDARTVKATAAARDASKASLDITRAQYKDGYVAYLAVLTANQAYQQARIALVQAEADRFADTAALFQALGGGWWHRPELDQGTK